MACMFIIVAYFMSFVFADAADIDACGFKGEPIKNFDLNEYLGFWHQIAVNHRFFDVYERNYPDCVYANYSANPNGTVLVANNEFNANGQSTTNKNCGF